MSKVGNKELATTLAEKYGLSKQASEKFVTTLFNIITEGLVADKQVKVKGLGTFKIVSVASRKSVDVNTGEPIVIKGRDKINFIPDATLRDEVNKPFMQFDTVVVNDGVDFSGIDRKYSIEEDNEDEVQLADNPSAETSNGMRSNAKEEEVDSEAKAESTGVIERLDSADGDESMPKDADAQPEATFVEEQQPESIREQPVIGEPSRDVGPSDKTDTYETTEAESQEGKAGHEIATNQEGKSDESDESVEEEEEMEEEVEDYHKEHKTLKYVVIGAIVVVVLCLCGAYYMFDQLQKKNNRIEHLEAQVKANVARPTAKVDNGQSVRDAGKTKAEASAIESAKSVAQETKAPVTNASQTTNREDKKVDNRQPKETVEGEDFTAVSKSDARIRTGAYVITGIDHTVTAKAGQTLSSISRANLGPGMECYIEAVNGGRKEFKEGDKVRIPKLKLKKLAKGK